MLSVAFFDCHAECRGALKRPFDLSGEGETLNLSKERPRRVRIETMEQTL